MGLLRFVLLVVLLVVSLPDPARADGSASRFSEDGLKKAEILAWLEVACKSTDPAAHVWCVTNARLIHARVAALPAARRKSGISKFGAALDVCLRALSEPKNRNARPLAKAIQSALAVSEGQLQLQLASALARVPGGASRKLLLKWLKTTKNLPVATLVAVIDDIPIGGDEEAVPLLLHGLAVSPGKVLEAQLVALFNLKPAVLRAQGKLIVRETAKVRNEGFHEHRSLNARGKLTPKQAQRLQQLVERNPVWQTKRIVDSPPKPLTDGAQGMPGMMALWWRIIDLEPRGMRAPKASKGARPQYRANRPNLTWDGWLVWAKKGR